ncbi:tyrosine-type recombinase/integrase [Paracoccus sp. NBH48]|uniref:tyrosine-type recombinase/integrase n=1 Tax=Paracoccus sp. NBH48 TaxID=2596918 RepID=UPI00351C5D41
MAVRFGTAAAAYPAGRKTISSRRLENGPGLGHIHPHMLRHSCGFALANRGYDLRLIQDYLGHRDPRHTARYTRTAVSRFNGLW